MPPGSFKQGACIYIEEMKRGKALTNNVNVNSNSRFYTSFGAQAYVSYGHMARPLR